MLTPAGNWSSYPPHKHDEEVPGVETALEEIYYYEVARGGFGFQRVYGPARAARSTSAPRSAAATRSSCRTATTGRRWPRPASGKV